nr:IS4 family transposase [Treponema sp.]
GFYAVDATEISLNMNDFPWAEFRSTMSGVKINMKYDINSSTPSRLFITNAKEHENNTLKDMKLKKGDTVAFDRGYCNYKAFGDFCRESILFVTRLKESAQYRVIKKHNPRTKLITLDQTIQFTGVMTGRKCPYQLRMIKSVDAQTGSEISILTNIFDRTAEYVSKLYRARWNIEIFFKAIKQNLQIERFYGKTENAVKT